MKNIIFWSYTHLWRGVAHFSSDRFSTVRKNYFQSSIKMQDMIVVLTNTKIFELKLNGHIEFPDCFSERKGNYLFNDALNTFYLRLYGVIHVVQDHSDGERENPLLPHGLLFPISSKGTFICTIPLTG